MSLTFTTEKVPLHIDTDGTVRVAETRVTLDSIVSAFEDGATAEEIAQRYPSVDLADVYAVIGYYLHQRDEVIEYMSARNARADSTRQENEFRFNPQGVRARLMARRKR